MACVPPQHLAVLALLFNFASALCTIVANKYALKVFHYPAALTAIHYSLSWVAVKGAHRLGVFQRGTVPREQKKLFYSLVIAWATCNALSNASLEANSVGFYQLMKVLTTPIVVFIDFVWHGKVISLGKALVLAFACVGIAVATVSDVQLSPRGTLIALASVMFGVAQKTLNEHMQQRGGLSTLQLMLEAFPPMTFIGLALVPLMDPPGLLTFHYTPIVITKILFSGVVAVCINFSTTLVLGVTSALSLVLLGQVKTCAIMIAGLILFDPQPNRRAFCGATTAVLGIGWYTVLKVLERRAKERKPPVEVMSPAVGDMEDSAMPSSKQNSFLSLKEEEALLSSTRTGKM
ncbi:hypothetical protein AB1Y20_015288 [Prymnesium parvum]|uniref:Sugar phosphate transporter domain-containing protein n=1 Tax=Prymnesium parvum TaxID=97485 RepID=A0AB34JXA7_PRYPA